MSDDYDDIDNATMSNQERRIRRQVRKQAEFNKHLLTYVVVISLLWVICLSTLPSGAVLQGGLLTGEVTWYRLWAFWPTIGWGIGLFFHGMSVLPGLSRWGSDWEERKVQELMAKQQASENSRG